MTQRLSFEEAADDRDAHIAVNHPDTIFPYWTLSITRYTFP